MEETQPAAQRPKRSLSGTALKYIACLSMLLDHIGASCLEQGPLAALAAAPSDTWGSLLAVQPALYVPYYTDIVLRQLGRLAFPIYCFLLVEGFLHTHDVKRYLLRLAAFAALSEVPFDLAFFESPFYPQYQNVFFTLLLGLACLLWLQQAEKQPGIKSRLLGIAGILLCGAAAELFQSDYGFAGVALIAVLYLMRYKGVWQLAAGAIVMCWEPASIFAFILLHFYNDTRGRCTRAEQYAFYAFYPVHLSILAGIVLLAL
ncbi:MAG: conjugal transfer protein TraX [Faecalibacterium sp.]|jgi:hypothetical protein|nr:conjugal transfer protein TraX [Faecalibacterium sp.]